MGLHYKRGQWYQLMGVLHSCNWFSYPLMLMCICFFKYLSCIFAGGCRCDWEKIGMMLFADSSWKLSIPHSTSASYTFFHVCFILITNEISQTLNFRNSKEKLNIEPYPVSWKHANVSSYVKSLALIESKDLRFYFFSPFSFLPSDRNQSLL